MPIKNNVCYTWAAGRREKIYTHHVFAACIYVYSPLYVPSVPSLRAIEKYLCLRCQSEKICSQGIFVHFEDHWKLSCVQKPMYWLLVLETGNAAGSKA